MLVFFAEVIVQIKDHNTFADAGILIKNDTFWENLDKAIRYDRVSHMDIARSLRDNLIGTFTLCFWGVTVFNASLVLRKEIAEDLCKKMNGAFSVPTPKVQRMIVYAVACMPG